MKRGDKLPVRSEEAVSLAHRFREYLLERCLESHINHTASVAPVGLWIIRRVVDARWI